MDRTTSKTASLAEELSRVRDERNLATQRLLAAGDFISLTSSARKRLARPERISWDKPGAEIEAELERCRDWRAWVGTHPDEWATA